MLNALVPVWMKNDSDIWCSLPTHLYFCQQLYINDLWCCRCIPNWRPMFDFKGLILCIYNAIAAFYVSSLFIFFIFHCNLISLWNWGDACYAILAILWYVHCWFMNIVCLREHHLFVRKDWALLNWRECPLKDLGPNKALARFVEMSHIILKQHEGYCQLSI